jgi:hypothetical protein
MNVFKSIFMLCLLLPSVHANAYDKEAGDSLNASLLSQWSVGPCSCITIKDDLAYYGIGGYLVIADVSDPAVVVELARITLPGLVLDLDVADGYVYAALNYEGMCIIDISDPTAPFITGSLYTGDRVEHIAVNGDYVYLTLFYDCMRMINVSDPYNPAMGDCFPNTGRDTKNVLIQDGFIYVLANGLLVFDGSNPSVPILLGYHENSGYDIAVRDGRAYVTGGSELQTFLVSDPENIHKIRDVDMEGTGTSVKLAGDYAFVSIHFKGLQVFDITHVTEPTEVAFFATGGGGMQLDLQGEYAYVADHFEGLKLIDISDVANLHEAAAEPAGDMALSVVVQDGLAYIAERNSGLIILDVSDPSSPGVISSTVLDDIVWDVDVAGDLAYVAAGARGMLVLDVSDPMNPLVIGRFPHNVSDAMYVSIEGDLAYLADKYGALYVLNIANPRIPVFLGWCGMGGGIDSPIAVQDGFVYAVDLGREGFKIIDATNPAYPARVGLALHDKLLKDVAVEGNYAYLATVTMGLCVMDVSDPTAPAWVWSESDVMAHGIALDRQFAYLASNRDGLRIYDIADPTSPVLVGYCDTGEASNAVFAHRDIAYVCETETGLSIVRNDLVVPVYLSTFQAEIQSGHPQLNWSVTVYSDAEDFRLIGEANGREWTVAHQRLADADYQAIDLDPLAGPGETIRYSLMNGSDATGWQFLGEKTLSLPEVPDMVRMTIAPNPFNPSTTVSWSMPTTGQVNLSVYDASGRLIKTLLDEAVPAGPQTIEWNGRDATGRAVSSGSYFVRLQGERTGEVRKIMLVR